jgi:ribosomal subunit interface protein
MQVPLQITFHDVDRSDALENHIREKASKLEQFYSALIGCKVVVDQPGLHQNKGKPFNIRIDLTVPGGEIVVDRQKDEDVYVALRDAFDAARRKLEDYGRRQRLEVKAHEPVLPGRVARLVPEERYGFIAGIDGREFYFSAMNLANGTYDELREGDEVHFIEGAGSEGLQARRVTLRGHEEAEAG